MIYQFEHEEIKQCEYCKLCDLNFDWCNMQSCLIDKYESPKFNDCPLAAISKTETTNAKKITVDIQLRPLIDDLEVDIDDIKEYINKLD